jgi:hypothetical protein
MTSSVVVIFYYDALDIVDVAWVQVNTAKIPEMAGDR